MTSILVTGASGFIGSRLVARVVQNGHKVIALSRKPLVVSGVTSVIGNFSDLKTVNSLAKFHIDSVIHLGGVTGDASEEEALSVNVLGSSVLLRALIDQGVQKFIVASSIAAAGCLSANFMPRVLPIPDDHPCDSSNPYGLSKFFLEELCAYFHRLDPSLDFTLFRIGAVLNEDSVPPSPDQIKNMKIPFCTLGCISIQDVVDAFDLASSKTLGSGFRVMNLVSKRVNSSLPTIEALRLSLGRRIDQLNLEYYQHNDREFDGIYDLGMIEEILGFVPKINF